MKNLIALISGLLFSIGLSISAMVDPNKVKGFLNLIYDWDPTLIFVMGGAVGVNLIFFPKLIKSRKTFFKEEMSLPVKTMIDKRLITGAALFGIGWGITGVCPGPALSNLFLLNPLMILFVLSMLFAMTLMKFFESK